MELSQAQYTCHRHTRGKYSLFMESGENKLRFGIFKYVSSHWSVLIARVEVLMQHKNNYMFVCISHANMLGYTSTLAFLSQNNCILGCLNHTFLVCVLCVHCCQCCQFQNIYTTKIFPASGLVNINSYLLHFSCQLCPENSLKSLSIRALGVVHQSQQPLTF